MKGYTYSKRRPFGGAALQESTDYQCRVVGANFSRMMATKANRRGQEPHMSDLRRVLAQMLRVYARAQRS